MAKFTAIDTCRISKSKNLQTVLDLGSQVLTGVFPQSKEEHVDSGPIELVWCPDSGLVQLRHSFEPSEMYGENYGYRSGLNASMVRHLEQKVRFLENLARPTDGEIVLDIGSNDATTLKAYANPKLRRIGIDPTGSKFRRYYRDDITLVPDFFSADAYRSVFADPAKIVTSIAMFYDLEDPIAFARQVESILADDGIWHFEQSYLPMMLRANSYDTMCHEHLEYYSLQSVEYILQAADLAVVDVRLNDINGGSFAVTAAKRSSSWAKRSVPEVAWMREEEARIGLNSRAIYDDFRRNVEKSRESLVSLLRRLRADGKKVLGYGASTKGNVTLQYCGLGPDDIIAIEEVNPDKFGHVTPGSHIPIVSPQEARALKPDYFLVLPWHFRNGILAREQEYLNDGGKFIFPFPHVEIV
jgi:hypothetical protein